MILSINRFERKKNIELAIDSFAALGRLKNFDELRLVISGGYDRRVQENVDYMKELIALCDKHALKNAVFGDDIPSDTQVLFVPSFTENQRSYLLSKSQCLIYTPSNEHFGIVPLEAMYARLPVIAVNSGGPLETVIHEKTGYADTNIRFLCTPDAESFSARLEAIITTDIKAKMGEAGRMHVKSKFSLDAFTTSLEESVCDILQTTNEDALSTHRIMFIIPVLTIVSLAFLSAVL